MAPSDLSIPPRRDPTLAGTGVPSAYRNFLVLRRLDRWPGGQVFLGREEGRGRAVVIKTLELGRTKRDTSLLPRFLRETQVHRKLDHPSIQRILTSGVQEDEHFLVLECISDTTLAARLDAWLGVPPVDWAAKVLRQVLEALEHAHAQGVIHRKLTPSAVLVDAEDRVVVTDFEVAAADDSLLQTTAGTRLGDARYASPEQNLGRPVTPASDLYSVGLLLWEMLAGQRLFSDNLQKTLQAQAANAIESPTVRRPHVPKELDHVCQRLLRSDLETRFKSAREVLDVLRGYEAFKAG